MIANNYFHTVRNRTARECAQIHPVYLAHYSSGTRIEGHTFEDFCGAAIKLRDRSNDNTIIGNHFKTGDSVTAIDEWYCDAETNGECTKAGGECPSTGNIARDNRFSPPFGVKQFTVRGKRQPRSSSAMSSPRPRKRGPCSSGCATGLRRTTSTACGRARSTPWTGDTATIRV
ncbi:hypothetical protein OLX02_13445 [Novosphingobium sp. KCTC 2891]|uniref:hypothetical protein n=1 Tax=Novosphingobium sp. KCTC 2891 TaxID=2989730 RepID=UPI002222B25E|nr:hypothetical protein [Novosphingobium sp. KCTC 2891]MCW1383825.1 hypothetical protein [Novosphingobium sp. KCTC 2891]